MADSGVNYISLKTKGSPYGSLGQCKPKTEPLPFCRTASGRVFRPVRRATFLNSSLVSCVELQSLAGRRGRKAGRRCARCPREGLRLCAIRPDSDLGPRQAPRCPGPTFALRLRCGGRADRSASGDRCALRALSQLFSFCGIFVLICVLFQVSCVCFSFFLQTSGFLILKYGLLGGK